MKNAFNVMNARLTLIACTALLLLAFAFDMITPQALVAAILLTIPVALSSLLLDRRVTASFVVAALIADVIAGWYNGVVEGHRWDGIAVANRALAGFSIVLVGVLGSLAQAAAQRSGLLNARQRQAERERLLRRSMETIRSSLNVELVARAIVREAISALEAADARLYTIENHALAATTFSWERNSEDVTVSRDRPTPELLSLLQRSLSERRLVVVTPADALGRLVLDTLAAQRALLVPLINPQVTFGVLLLMVDDAAKMSPDLELWVQAFGEQATVAAAQASLFVELADRNTELRQANASLAQRGEVIRDLVYALSHDLRTPLTAAAMTMQQALVGMYGPLPDIYREILRRSIASNDELRYLAETLLLVARYESGEESRVRELVRLDEVLRSVARELESMWRAKNINFLVIAADDATVFGDEAELRRAVMNLLANAINWTPDDGTISASASNSNGQVTIRVEDDGYGVPDELRAQLFQRFAPDESVRRGGGSGLGLYIVKRIAESHGGGAAYQPREPRGSIFVLNLPAAAPRDVEPTMNSAAYAPRRTG